MTPKHAAIPDTILVCRTCRQPIHEVRIGDQTVYGHGTNPTFQHHYARPRVAAPSESELRALHGDR
jgi:hypothetical protein